MWLIDVCRCRPDILGVSGSYMRLLQQNADLGKNKKACTGLFHFG
jgi:hypothetical protein